MLNISNGMGEPFALECQSGPNWVAENKLRPISLLRPSLTTQYNREPPLPSHEIPPEMTTRFSVIFSPSSMLVKIASSKPLSILLARVCNHSPILLWVFVKVNARLSRLSFANAGGAMSQYASSMDTSPFPDTTAEAHVMNRKTFIANDRFLILSFFISSFVDDTVAA